MPKAVIFDLNGIFVQSEKLSDRFAKDFGVPADTFVGKLSEIMNNVRQKNAGPAFRHWEGVLTGWGIQFTEHTFWQYWFKEEHESPEVVALARELKEKGIKVFILSNNFKERAEFYDHYPWMHEVIDKAYFSWQTGFVKPDLAAWKYVLSENNLEPEECIYFDDQQKNVMAAESLGIKSYLFETADKARDLILKH